MITKLLILDSNSLPELIESVNKLKRVDVLTITFDLSNGFIDAVTGKNLFVENIMKNIREISETKAINLTNIGFVYSKQDSDSFSSNGYNSSSHIIEEIQQNLSNLSSWDYLVETTDQLHLVTLIESFDLIDINHFLHSDGYSTIFGYINSNIRHVGGTIAKVNYLENPFADDITRDELYHTNNWLYSMYTTFYSENIKIMMDKYFNPTNILLEDVKKISLKVNIDIRYIFSENNNETDSKITNVILYDLHLDGYLEDVQNSLLSNTVIMTFRKKNSFAEIKKALNSLQTDETIEIANVALFQNNSQQTIYNIVSEESSIIKHTTSQDPSLNTWTKFTEFVLFLEEELCVDNLDLLMCRIYSDENWKYVIDSVSSKLDELVIRSSEDVTGHIIFDGDWTLESPDNDVNLVGLYFNETIKDIKIRLDSQTNIVEANSTSNHGYVEDVATNSYTKTSSFGWDHFIGLTYRVPYGSFTQIKYKYNCHASVNNQVSWTYLQLVNEAIIPKGRVTDSNDGRQMNVPFAFFYAAPGSGWGGEGVPGYGVKDFQNETDYGGPYGNTRIDYTYKIGQEAPEPASQFPPNAAWHQTCDVVNTNYPNPDDTMIIDVSNGYFDWYIDTPGLERSYIFSSARKHYDSSADIDLKNKYPLAIEILTRAGAEDGGGINNLSVITTDNFGGMPKGDDDQPFLDMGWDTVKGDPGYAGGWNTNFYKTFTGASYHPGSDYASFHVFHPTGGVRGTIELDNCWIQKTLHGNNKRFKLEWAYVNQWHVQILLNGTIIEEYPSGWTGGYPASTDTRTSTLIITEGLYCDGDVIKITCSNCVFIKSFTYGDLPYRPADKTALQQAVTDWIGGDTTTYGHISKWDTTNITNMASLFQQAGGNFNEDIGSWNVSNVTAMNHMFYGCSEFNQDLSNWNVSNVTNMSNMFYGCKKFNTSINNWDVGNVIAMDWMFYHAGANSYNQPLNNWNVSNVTNFKYMFGYTSFNQDIGSWDVANGTQFNGMFVGDTIFNQDLNSWEIKSNANLSNMFQNTTSFVSVLSGYYWLMHSGNKSNIFSGSNGSLGILPDDVIITIANIPPPGVDTALSSGFLSVLGKHKFSLGVSSNSLNITEADLSFTNGIVSNFNKITNNSYTFEVASSSLTESTILSIPEDSLQHTDLGSEYNEASNVFEWTWNYTIIPPDIVISSVDISNGENHVGSFINMEMDIANDDLQGNNVKSSISRFDVSVVNGYMFDIDGENSSSIKDASDIIVTVDNKTTDHAYFDSGSALGYYMSTGGSSSSLINYSSLLSGNYDILVGEWVVTVDTHSWSRVGDQLTLYIDSNGEIEGDWMGHRSIQGNYTTNPDGGIDFEEVYSINMRSTDSKYKHRYPASPSLPDTLMWYHDGYNPGGLLTGKHMLYKKKKDESPLLNHIVGNRYTFDQSDSTNTGHPLLFFEDYSKTTPYSTGVITTGTAGSSGSKVSIEITEGTPSTLYYQCGHHELMGYKINIKNKIKFKLGSSSTTDATTLTIPQNSMNRIFNNALTAQSNNVSNTFSWNYSSPDLTITSLVVNDANRRSLEPPPASRPGTSKNILWIQFTFSESVYTINKKKFLISNCKITNISVDSTFTIYTLKVKTFTNAIASVTINPDESFSTGRNIEKNVSGVDNSSFEWEYNDSKQEISMTSSQVSGLTNNAPFIDLTFKTALGTNDFTVDSITLTGDASLSDFTVISTSEYSVRVIPNDVGAINVSVNNSVFTDSTYGTLNSNEVSYDWIYDNVPPTVIISSPTIVDGESSSDYYIELDFAMSKPVTDFVLRDDLNVVNGTLGALTRLTDSLYSAKLYPTLNNSTITVTVLSNTITDGAGNKNVYDSNVFDWLFNSDDLLVSLTSNEITNGESFTNKTITITLTTSDSIVELVNEDIVCTNGTIGTITNVDSTTKTFAVTSDSPNTETTIQIPAEAVETSGVVKNIGSNLFTWTHKPPIPVLTIESSQINDGDFTNISSVDFTLTFDNSSVVFSEQDLQVTNGSIVSNSFSGSGSIYHVSITSSISEGIITLTLPKDTAHVIDNETHYNDVSYNFEWNYDSVSPVITISSTLIVEAATTSLTSLSLNISSTKHINGLSTNDFLVSNGVVSNLSDTSGTEFTLKIEPFDSETDCSINIYLSEISVVDIANNANAPSNIFSFSYIFFSRKLESSAIVDLFDADTDIPQEEKLTSSEIDLVISAAFTIPDTSSPFATTNELEEGETVTFTPPPKITIPSSVKIVNRKVFTKLIDQIFASASESVLSLTIDKSSMAITESAEEELAEIDEIVMVKSNQTEPIELSTLSEDASVPSAAYIPLANAGDFVIVSISGDQYTTLANGDDTFALSNTNGSLGTFSVNDVYTIGDRYKIIFGSETIVDGGEPESVSVPCFLEGTRILTTNGYKSIEKLNHKKDTLLDKDNKPLKILDIQKYSQDNNGKQYPYKIPCGSILSEDYTCTSDLYLTYNHCIYLPHLDTFVPVSFMRHMKEEKMLTRDKFTYYHIFTENYFSDTLMANGIPCESHSKFTFDKLRNIDPTGKLLNKMIKKADMLPNCMRKRLTTKEFKNVVKKFKNKQIKSKSVVKLKR